MARTPDRANVLKRRDRPIHPRCVYPPLSTYRISDERTPLATRLLRIIAAVDDRAVTNKPALYLTVGLPGAGKTTLARQIADTEGILRLTPDEWMAPLFRDSEADGRRDILEGRMIWVARQVLRSGASVILDFGCWSPEERYAIRVIAESVGARFDLRHVSIEEMERRARARSRWESAPDTTFAMSDADHDRFLALCRPPSPEELSYAPVPDSPPGFGSWFHWASARWPTLPRFDEVHNPS